MQNEFMFFKVLLFLTSKTESYGLKQGHPMVQCSFECWCLFEYIYIRVAPTTTYRT